MSTVAAVFGLRDDGAHCAAPRRQAGLRDAGKWVPPGGHLDDGDPAECARRELREKPPMIPKSALAVLFP